MCSMSQHMKSSTAFVYTGGCAVFCPLRGGWKGNVDCGYTLTGVPIYSIPLLPTNPEP